MISYLLLFIWPFLQVIIIPTSNKANSPSEFKTYICYQTNKSINIDGRLNEGAWEKASFSDLFIDIEGSKKPDPIYDTRIKLLWDNDNLYVGVWLEEPHIWATYTKRESVIFHENDFEIFIDPNGDTHNYYEIEINALNTIWDLLLTKPYRDHGKALTSWNLEGMKTAVHIEGTNNDPSDQDKYWSIEFALPWSSLKEYATEKRKPKDGEQWRMNFSRVQWRLDIVDGTYAKEKDPETNKPFPEYNWVWSPQGVIAMHQPETWGFVQFSKLLVGSDDTKFNFNNDENCKWELRKIYYAQKEFKRQHQKFANNLRDLNYSNEFCKEASISLTSSETNFLALLRLESRNTNWKINTNGLVWME